MPLWWKLWIWQSHDHPVLLDFVGLKGEKDAKSHTEDMNKNMARRNPRITITGLACREDRLLVCSFSNPSSRSTRS